MFAPAASLELNVVDGVFTHFKHEEDATMKSGKFDEELSRMNDIATIVTPRALILFNEAFAATNEREGSEIARQIVSALLERPNKIVFISHQYDFAHGIYRSSSTRRCSCGPTDRKTDGGRSSWSKANRSAQALGKTCTERSLRAERRLRLPKPMQLRLLRFGPGARSDHLLPGSANTAGEKNLVRRLPGSSANLCRFEGWSPL